jgi:hypothetical protein
VLDDLRRSRNLPDILEFMPEDSKALALRLCHVDRLGFGRDDCKFGWRLWKEPNHLPHQAWIEPFDPARTVAFGSVSLHGCGRRQHPADQQHRSATPAALGDEQGRVFEPCRTRHSGPLNRWISAAVLGRRKAGLAVGSDRPQG